MDKKTPDASSIFELRNIRYFIAFRFFFSSRFYYPVFAILFLDFGLTLEQFAILNTVWAITIVVMEVPSGALADVFGRVRLLNIAGWLMVIEMALLCLAPMGNVELLFIIFIFNRICSGAAEAMASGADESLAYETLLTNGAEDQWSKVLSRQMRFTSIGGAFTMIFGALLYDPEIVQILMNVLGIQTTITQKVTLRIPLFLTFIFAVVTLILTFRMQETAENMGCRTGSWRVCHKAVLTSFKIIFNAGSWILQQHFALVVILSGLIFDHVTRIIITLDSQYFRIIDIPEAAFGIIGATMAGVGIWVATLAEHLANNRSPKFNFLIVGGLILFGLTGITFFYPWFGLIPILALAIALTLIPFFQSHYLNQITDSHQRATVLSFRGLTVNLAYGAGGILFALLLAGLRSNVTAIQPELNDTAIETTVFKMAIRWFPVYFAILMIVLTFLSRYLLRSTRYPHLKTKSTLDRPDNRE